VLHDEDLAAAILDRILERGRLIHLDGPSGRTRHLNLDEVLPAAAERARISGIGVPEFPEPTIGRQQRQQRILFSGKLSSIRYRDEGIVGCLNLPRLHGIRGKLSLS
jgi:hypothetical protein